MYRMSNSEFIQYQSAERRLRELRIQHAYELQQAYDGINPTITRFDYESGSIHSESINPADYAIYLIELKEEHQRQQRWWRLRAEAYQEALQKLTEEERMDLYGSGPYRQVDAARKKLKEILTKIVETRQDLKRQFSSFNSFEDVEEADRQIEKMNMKELLTDYRDFMDQEQEERLKKQCIYLYQSCDWPFSMIGKRLGIPTSRVKKYVNSFESSKPIGTHSIPQRAGNVEITYLSPDKLEEYRSGQRGGSKWCSYDDYLQMKADGLNKKEIASKLGIEVNELSYRIRFWKASKANRQLVVY